MSKCLISSVLIVLVVLVEFYVSDVSFRTLSETIISWNYFVIPFPQKNNIEVIDSLIEESNATIFSSETKVSAFNMSFKQKEPSIKEDNPLPRVQPVSSLLFQTIVSDIPLQNSTVEANLAKPIKRSPTQSVEVITIKKVYSSTSSSNTTRISKSSEYRSEKKRRCEELIAKKLVFSYKLSLSCLHCYLFKNNKLSPFSLQSANQTYRKHRKMDVTVISALSEERIPFIPYLVNLWKGPVVLSLIVPYDEVKSVGNTLKTYSLSSRVRIVIMAKKRTSKSFPINRLRNLAISFVTTSHYLVLDMDMFPTTNLYDELISLPTELTSVKDNIFIVPAVFLDRMSIIQSCDTLVSCAQRSLQYIPKNKQELFECYHNGTCFIRKSNRNNRNHRLLSPEWVNTTHPSFTKVDCFPNRFQEPYVMVKREPDEIVFNPMFINYGCNKVQMIEHLRSTNHSFYLLNNAFATDIVHHNSPYRDEYVLGVSIYTRMGQMCYSFLAALEHVYGNNSKTPLCY